MPLYEYRCKSCGKKHEEHATIDRRDRDGVECPHCGATGCVRELSIAAVLGGGAYGPKSSSLPPVPS
jgi:putative FmdB family regulatory protein